MKALEFKTLHLFIAVFILLWALSARERPVQDGAVMATVASNLVVQGQLHYDYRSPGYTVEGPDGLHYGKYPLGWSLLLVPGQMLERLASTSGLSPSDKELTIRLVRGLVPAATGALAVVLLFQALILAGFSLGTGLLVTLTFHLATCALPYLRSFYSEVFQVATVNLALLSYMRFRRGSDVSTGAWLGASLGLLVLAKVVLGLLALVMGAAALTSLLRGPARRGRLLVSLAAGATPFLLLFFWYNWLRYGVPFTTHYGFYLVPEELGHPLMEGLYGLLLSSGRGLLWFAPVVLLSLPAFRHPFRAGPGRQLVPVAAGGAVLVLLFYASWTVWHGAEQWGPRFLVPLTGLFAVLGASTAEGLLRRGVSGRLLLSGLVAAGLLVNVPGLLIHHMTFFEAVPYKPYSSVPLDGTGQPTEPVESDNLHRVNYVPAFSPIRGHWWLLDHAVNGGDLESDCPWQGHLAGESPVRTRDLKPRVNLWFLPGESWPSSTRTQAWIFLFIMASALVGMVYEMGRRWPRNKS